MGIFYKMSDGRIYEKYKYKPFIQLMDWVANRPLDISK